MKVGNELRRHSKSQIIQVFIIDDGEPGHFTSGGTIWKPGWISLLTNCKDLGKVTVIGGCILGATTRCFYLKRSIVAESG